MNTVPSEPSPVPPIARGHRTSTIVWAMVTFAFLFLCGAVAALLLATGGRLPALEQGVSWTPLPAVAATAASAGASTGERSADRPFLAGDTVRNVSGGRVNLRQTPGFQNKPVNDVISVLDAGTEVTMIAGPEHADGLRWWLVRSDAGEGWMAERSNSGKVLLGPLD